MQAIEMKCNQVGTIEFGKVVEYDSFHVDESGALAHYQAMSAEVAHKIAMRYSNVLRPNGQRLRGVDYSIRMAKNDFRSFI